jgi:hypothetical protein
MARHLTHRILVGFKKLINTVARSSLPALCDHHYTLSDGGGQQLFFGFDCGNIQPKHGE